MDMITLSKINSIETSYYITDEYGIIMKIKIF